MKPTVAEFHMPLDAGVPRTGTLRSAPGAPLARAPQPVGFWGVRRAPSTRCRATSDGSDSASSSSGESGGNGLHWTAKLTGGDAKDELRYMDSRALEELGGASGLPWSVTGVLRDRDNATLVNDAQLLGPFLAQELGCDEKMALQHLRRVLVVIPALAEGKGRLAKLGVKQLASLCADVPGLVQRLIFLKRLFPDVDVGRMVSASPFLLSEDEALLEEGVDALHELFPFAGEEGTPGVDRMAASVPQLLDAQFARRAVQQLGSLYGGDAARAVHRNPKLALQVESAALRSRYSVSFDQTHVRANKVVPLDRRDKEEYYEV
mmetsp:Transcript_39114/g.70049  ORF Transcript_39114/g.70049 Transcript_39114/m.70049 type:complete len:320 (-) Transcript_39114:54-1013(-)